MHDIFLQRCLIRMIAPVSEAAQQGQQDAICCVLFGHVCESKFSNFVRFCLFGMVQPLA